MPLEPRKIKPRRIIHVAVADRYQAFVKGELTVHDLDDDEIMRGQIRNKAGTFQGRPPNYVPREFATAVAKRQKEIMQQEISGLVLKAMRTLEEIMDKQHAQPGDGARVKAAQEILARNLGRVPETVNLRAEITTWERHMGEVVVDYTIEPTKEIEQ